MLKIVNIQQVEEVTHYKHKFPRYICKDEKGVLYHVICLSKRIPQKALRYRNKHGVPRAIVI